MDKRFQDINVVDKEFKTMALVIPRGSHIKSISFQETRIQVSYVDNLGYVRLSYLEYEDLENGRKIVID